METARSRACLGRRRAEEGNGKKIDREEIHCPAIRGPEIDGEESDRTQTDGAEIHSEKNHRTQVRNEEIDGAPAGCEKVHDAPYGKTRDGAQVRSNEDRHAPSQPRLTRRPRRTVQPGGDPQ